MKLLFVLFCLCAAINVLAVQSLAHQKPYEKNCVDTAQNWQNLSQAQKEGAYRFANEQGVIAYPIEQSERFSVYIAKTKALISSRNIRANQPCPILTPVAKALGYTAEQLTVADLVAPFELRQANDERAILLIHGLTDSPFTFHYLGAAFHQQGYTVRTVLLPGHATAPSDLKHVELSHWQNTVGYAIARTAKDFKQFAILGYSTGAALAIANVAKSPPENLRAMALISPASEPHNKHGWLAKWIAKIPFVEWIDEDADLDFAKYESFPWQAAALADEAMNLLKHVSLPKALPLFTAFSEVDSTIDSTATLAMLKRFGDKNQKVENHTLYFYGNPRAAIAQLPEDYEILQPTCTHTACDKVIDMSHIGILQPPSHPYYGFKGIYRSCGGYLNDLTKYLECKQHSAPLLGERTKSNMSHTVPLQRLTFNPAYDDFTYRLSNFLNDAMPNHVHP
ncbi:alpha/beta fold hydrolase [Pseudoalteromonas sp. JBTF-M23]|uniref:Alpha/beta fold hydrolase n=1 Tax=Pseudoalteromonas caenipelagi TaxID=2726988 RepID=A0A849VKR6_9GAMM|nr:alpha/beta fold hydrolase [Pseudoalteromonas caenipelagi]NOU53023.1 alpha/beta fold hydrolase [Pseudoalteromonas caenipelagi]